MCTISSCRGEPATLLPSPGPGPDWPCRRTSTRVALGAAVGSGPAAATQFGPTSTISPPPPQPLAAALSCRAVVSVGPRALTRTATHRLPGRPAGVVRPRGPRSSGGPLGGGSGGAAAADLPLFSLLVRFVSVASCN